MGDAFSWTCKYCNQPTTITDPHFHSDSQVIYLDNSKYGKIGYEVLAVSCPNLECKELELIYILCSAVKVSGRLEVGSEIKKWFLLPDSSAKPQPDYIPDPIKQDYYEACKIRDLSPKASATLARRCLQGMIRDFHDITKGRLIDEIEAIKDTIESEVWTAIDAVRKMGNIGAHMEKDINVIIDVDPDEAQQLIGLIEMLFKEWYVAKKERQDRLAAIQALGNKKDDVKNSKEAN
ncbi:MAG: DUF4145 domain-containing protein [Candidatus Nitrohelix vancouverensis]|uniref:DUF4145 domain-containing protein n=1 Tax=Candidatus Nitrohelix vancouverensis TaxID=2705534 RepID=A0A7T0G4D3_9BACT|nr:MAG: DUF4145 domain-containing protein [Candidatus Nitrohelix vancouverensis]